MGTPRPQTYITSGGWGVSVLDSQVGGDHGVHQHSLLWGGTTKVEKQVIAKVKSLQSGDQEAENKMAFSKFAKDHLTKGQVEAPPTQRYGKCVAYGASYGRIIVIVNV